MTTSAVTPIRVLVVDDHSVVREGIRHVLGDSARFTVIGEASSGVAAIAASAELQPDVVVLDISMPGGSGLHAVADILERAPTTRILMLSVHDDVEYVLESARAGAHGYLLKDSSPAELRAAIEKIFGGEEYYSASVTAQLAGSVRSARDAETPVKPPRAVDVLTARERQILGHIAEGMTNKEIGATLGISARTVEAHRDSLMRKIGIRTVAGLTRLALEQGLI